MSDQPLSSPPAPPAPPASSAPPATDLTRVISPPLLALAVFVLVGGALAILRAGSPILNPVILSLFIVTLVLPAYRWLRGRGLSVTVALLVIAGVVLVVGGALGLIAWFAVGRLLGGLGDYTPRIQQSVRALLAQAGQAAANDAGGSAARLFAGFLTVLASSVVQFLFSIILTAFLLIEAPRFGRLLRTSMRNLPFLGMTPQVMDAAIRYFFVRLKINALSGAVFVLFFLLIGVPSALLWGILIFLLSFVPYIGLVVATVPPVLLALAISGWPLALTVVITITVVNFLIENIVAPSLTGKTLSLSPAVVFISFAFWMWLLGALGALVAMPITVLLMLTFRQYEATRWVAQLIGTMPDD